jgi:hypothetical protein
LRNSAMSAGRQDVQIEQCQQAGKTCKLSNVGRLARHANWAMSAGRQDMQIYHLFITGISEVNLKHAFVSEQQVTKFSSCSICVMQFTLTITAHWSAKSLFGARLAININSDNTLTYVPPPFNSQYKISVPT